MGRSAATAAKYEFTVAILVHFRGFVLLSMKFRICLVVLAFVCFALRGVGQSLPTAEQTFPQLQPILTAALQQSPRMIEQNLDLEIAASDLVVARSGLYPSVGSSFRDHLANEKRKDISGTLNSDKLYYDISLTQPLFHWNERRNRAKIGRIQEQIAHKQYAQAYAGLAQEIRSAYLRLVIQKAQLEAATFAQAKAEQAYALAQERLRNRVISESEIFMPRINVDQAVLATDRARDSLDDTKRFFKALTGMAAPADEAIPTMITRTMATEGEINRLVAGFLSQAEPRTFATEILKARLDVERLNYAITKTNLRPKFNIVAGISQDEVSYTTNLAAKFGVRTQYVGISGNWTLFDGLATRGYVASALARVRKLEANYKRLTDDLGAEIQRSARQLQFAERQMYIQDQLFFSAEAFLKARKEDFSRGTAAEADVAMAQLSLNRELVATLQARADFLLRSSEFIASIMNEPALANLPARFR